MNASRRLDLDGLRGLAVLLVVGFHAGLPALRGAFVAVDVFFVLSGFFLATTLTRRLATGEDTRSGELVARRVWRLLPPLVVVLLCGSGSARCETERGGIVLYSDDNHITRSFSRSLGPVLGERVEAALRR